MAVALRWPRLLEPLHSSDSPGWPAGEPLTVTEEPRSGRGEGPEEGRERERERERENERETLGVNNMRADTHSYSPDSPFSGGENRPCAE